MNLSGETIHFTHPWFLLLLALIPLLALLWGARGQAPAIVFSSLAPLRASGKVRRAKRGNFLPSLLLPGLALLIIGLARPQLGRTLSRVQASGIDIMLAIDVSGSMKAEDMAIGSERASRIDAVKNVTQKFIENRPNDRIGLLCFAGQPYLVSPLTLDHDWLLQNLERVRLGLVEDGTAIGSGIASACNRLKDKEAKSKIVVLLTDGDNNAGKVTPMTAAEAAKALGIKVYTIGAGSRGRAPIPVQDMFGRTVYQMIDADLNEKLLGDIAKMTGAEFFRATDGKSLVEIFKQIDKMEKSTVELDQYKQFRDLFPWFLASGFAIIALEMLLAQTIWRKLP